MDDTSFLNTSVPLSRLWDQLGFLVIKIPGDEFYFPLLIDEGQKFLILSTHIIPDHPDSGGWLPRRRTYMTIVITFSFNIWFTYCHCFFHHIIELKLIFFFFKIHKQHLSIAFLRYKKISPAHSEALTIFIGCSVFESAVESCFWTILNFFFVSNYFFMLSDYFDVLMSKINFKK
jgi:hypothetical protein